MASNLYKGRLHGRTALITGSSSGLGRAIAHAYASEGANVCCVDMYASPRNPINPSTGKADDIKNRLTTPATHQALSEWFGNTRADGRVGPRFEFVQADITKAVDAEHAVAECVRIFGRLDIMVNNAGISVESQHVRPLMCHETPEEDYDATMQVNVKGVFLGAKYALKQMLDGQDVVDWDGLGMDKKDKWDRGWVVNTASIQGLVAYTCTPSYTASKGAVVMLTKQLALDYAKFRIHCNALCPGFLRTAMTQNLQGQPETFKEINDAHPFGGFGDPDDVARAAVFLASRDASWVTGVPLPVDGGYSAR